MINYLINSQIATISLGKTKFILETRNSSEELVFLQIVNKSR